MACRSSNRPPACAALVVVNDQRGALRRRNTDPKACGVREVDSLLHEPRIIRGTFPVAQLFLDVILGRAVAFLDLARELIAPAGDDVEVVIGQLAPLLLDAARDLFPVALNAIPVHTNLL